MKDVQKDVQNPGEGADMEVETKSDAGGAGGFIHEFSHQGRKHRLFKIGQTRAAAWYVRFRNERYSMRTNNAATAEARAKARLDKWKGKGWEAPKKSSGKGVKLIEVLKVYLADAVTVSGRIQQKTVVHNIRQLKLVLKGKGDGKHCSRHGSASWLEWAKDVPIADVSAEAAKELKARMVKAAGDDKKKRQRAMRSADSVLRQARSVFTRQMKDHYFERLGVRPEAWSGFVDVRGFGVRGVVDYSPASDDLIAKTLKDAGGLKKSDMNAYKAFWLAAGCGLRKGEVSLVKWEHFEERDGRPYLRMDELGKGGEWVEAWVQSDGWGKLSPLKKKKRGYVLTGNATERKEMVFRRIGAWMKGMGWKTAKKLHEIRAYVGCRVAEEHGLLAAQLFLRHKDYATTRRNYGRYLDLKHVDVKLARSGKFDGSQGCSGLESAKGKP